jgi:hypothetical protein
VRSLIPTLEVPTILPVGYAGFVAPNGNGLSGQAWVAANSSNDDVYVLSSVRAPGGDEADVRFMRSEDGGDTWSDPVFVSDDVPGENIYHWFGMMSVAPNGRIDAAWNDTRINPEDPHWNELYYSYSTDRGVSWSKNIPVSQSFNSHIGYPNDPKLGDYYHMISDNLGVNVAYAATFNGEQDIYFLRIGPYDCNANEIPDEDDIDAGTSQDSNANAVPDECEYRVDVDGDRLTTLYDHAQFLTCLTGPQETTLTLPSALARERGEDGAPAAAAPSPLAKGGHRGVGPLPPFAILDSTFANPPGCTLMDPHHDGVVNLADFAFLQRAFAP